MKVWLDAQLSPSPASWMTSAFGVEVTPVKEHGLRNATDAEIFLAAREAGAIVMTKDRDFVSIVSESGAPPQILWVTCGNTSNARMEEVLAKAFPAARELLASGEPLVEISDDPKR